MCDFITPMLAAFSGAGAATTATGAVAGASTLAKIGTAISIGGSVLQGVMGAQAAQSQADHMENAARTNTVLASVKEQRERRQFRSQIRQQTAELAARGISLDSPTAVYLGQTAAREMSFQGQSTRFAGMARSQEYSAQAAAARARGTQSLLQGGLSAVGTFFNDGPELWPELLA